MYTLTATELRHVKAAVGFRETDVRSFQKNLAQLGKMNAGEARSLFEKALNAKAIQEDRGRVRMAAPEADPRGITELGIESLKQSGYAVYMVSDSDPPLYAWRNRSGASQSDVKKLQPYRQIEAQAWVDCSRYHSSDLPSIAEPDWKN